MTGGEPSHTAVVSFLFVFFQAITLYDKDKLLIILDNTHINTGIKAQKRTVCAVMTWLPIPALRYESRSRAQECMSMTYHHCAS